MVTAQPARREPSQEATTTLTGFIDGLRAVMTARGLRVARSLTREVSDDNAAPIVLHPIAPAAPHIFRRRSRAIFVVGLAELDCAPGEALAIGYPLLVRSLSNLLVLVGRPSGRSGWSHAHFLTLERGSYRVTATRDEQAFFAALADRIEPLATARLVVDNIFSPDLPTDLWEGDARTEAISRAGLQLKALDLLPPPVSVKDMLTPRDYRHCQRLFRIGGLSYGNLSARRGATSFWMSASGVDKSQLRTIGEEILLVTGYDASRNAIRLSVPPHRRPRRVSVDAIEHLLIYREHPGVQAIVHIHAWMAGVPATEINYPCGTLELGHAVAELVRQADNPGRAVVGLKNHGLTITGPSLEEIFDRLDGRVLRDIPMS
jgi:ribulose-5-phosphate 4-epimerase/fuculose-1-phosphate aldolase